MKQAVRRQFSQAASSYHEAAVVQREVATKLLQFLPQAAGERILEVGSGSGFLTELLLKHYPSARIDAVDISPQMIQHAKAQFGANNRLSFFEADIMHFRPPHSYDAIVSSAALQWLQPIDAGLAELRGMLEPGGWLSFSLMTSATLELLHQLRAELFPAKCGEPRLPTVAQVTSALAANQFRCHLGLETERYFQPLAAGQDVLSELKAIGVTAGKAQGGSFLTRRELLQLTESYQERCFERYGQLGVEYEVVYCAAKLAIE